MSLSDLSLSLSLCMSLSLCVGLFQDIFWVKEDTQVYHSHTLALAYIEVTVASGCGLL